MATISSQALGKLPTFDRPTICNLVELFEVCPRNIGHIAGCPQTGLIEFRQGCSFCRPY